MDRKGLSGYLVMCCFVIMHYFGSSHKVGNIGSYVAPGRREIYAILASSKPENDEEDDASPYQESTRVLGSSEYNNSSSSTSSYHGKNQSLSKNKIYYINGTYAVVNPWYGWQPRIKTMQCPWTACMEKNHTCKTCRDFPEDMNVTNSSSLDPGEGWIPDVTMLRRMYMDGHDANGNPWPPPLDDELCHVLDNSADTKKLLDEAKIVGAPIPRTPDETKGNKLLCFIYTMEKKHPNSIRAIRETWAPGCDGFLVFSTQSDPRIPAVSIPHRGQESYRNMWQKIRSMFQFVGKHYLSQFDWFYMGGDDLVVFPQNLKNYLATYNSSRPHYVGRRFVGKVGFNTGGPGYALSRSALQCLLEHLEETQCEPYKKTSQEDVMTARCLKSACNITYEDTRDDQGKERFHHFAPDFEYFYKGGKFWYYHFIKTWPILLHENSSSSESVNFHYIKVPGMARYLFHYVQQDHGCKRIS